MLEIYLKSIIVYMVIIYCATSVCKDSFIKRMNSFNNNFEYKKKKSFISRISNLFVLSAIPVLRFIIILAIFFISFCSKEDFEKMIKKSKE